MFRTLIEPPLTSSALSTPLLPHLLYVFPSRWPTTSTPQIRLLFGSFAEQSPRKRRMWQKKLQRKFEERAGTDSYSSHLKHACALILRVI